MSWDSNRQQRSKEALKSVAGDGLTAAVYHHPLAREVYACCTASPTPWKQGATFWSAWRAVPVLRNPHCGHRACALFLAKYTVLLRVPSSGS
jgi:deoxyribodipyrimidine photolyase